MVAISVPIACPCCGNEVMSLKFWRKAGGHYLHLCGDCCGKKTFTEEQLLRIGLHYGKYDMATKIEEAIERIKWN